MPPATPQLRPPRHRIERRAIVWWALRPIGFLGPVLVAMGVAAMLWPDVGKWLVAPAVVVALVLVVVAVVQPGWRYAVHRWETTDQAVYALTGWVVREWRVAPISRIQTVDAVRGPLEQVLGLATLRVTTASSQGAVKIVGLDKDLAERVAAELTALAEVIPGDAT